jgi:hypothetical protein
MTWFAASSLPPTKPPALFSLSPRQRSKSKSHAQPARGVWQVTCTYRASQIWIWWGPRKEKAGSHPRGYRRSRFGCLDEPFRFRCYIDDTESSIGNTEHPGFMDMHYVTYALRSGWHGSFPIS